MRREKSLWGKRGKGKKETKPTHKQGGRVEQEQYQDQQQMHAPSLQPLKNLGCVVVVVVVVVVVFGFHRVLGRCILCFWV